MVGIVAFRALTDGIVSEQQAFNPGPVDDTVDFFHSFDSPVVIQGVEKGDVGKGEAGHFLEAHISSKGVNLEEIWHKTNGSQVLINYISMLSLHKQEFATENHRKGKNDTSSCAKLSFDQSSRRQQDF